MIRMVARLLCRGKDYNDRGYITRGVVGLQEPWHNNKVFGRRTMTVAGI